MVNQSCPCLYHVVPSPNSYLVACFKSISITTPAVAIAGYTFAVILRGTGAIVSGNPLNQQNKFHRIYLHS